MALSPSSGLLLTAVPYIPPPWVPHTLANNAPIQRLQLGRFPTPIHAWNPFGNAEGPQFYIKRDDLSSFDLSGNKVRKLEFLLSEAVRNGHDSVITIGGIQSNHARSTAVAARQLGLDPFLILRSREPADDPGLVGNLLLDRMVGAKIYQVSPGTYAQLGQKRLLEVLRKQLVESGRNPFVIPVGGSDALGAWGYIEAVRELEQQLQELPLAVDHLVFACGSGGTATGLALALRLSGLDKRLRLHAVAVCDSADYFYEHIESTCRELGVDMTQLGTPRDWLSIHEGQGIGYARSTDAELRFIAEVSRTTGIVLDPVYSGKALYHLHCMLQEQGAAAPIRPGERVLFLHTGGVLGMYDKTAQLLPLLGDTPEKLVIDKSVFDSL